MQELCAILHKSPRTDRSNLDGGGLAYVVRAGLAERRHQTTQAYHDISTYSASLASGIYLLYNSEFLMWLDIALTTTSRYRESYRNNNID